MRRSGSIVISSTDRTQSGAIRILASFEQQLREGIESGKINRAKQERRAAEFQRALDAGEMPPLQSICFHDRLQPKRLGHDTAIRRRPILDVQTLMAVRNDESVIRWGLSRMAWYQKLSDELIVPNLDQDVSFFYDPTTKKLRKRFEIYPEALQANVKFANDLERAHTALLKRIQAERQGNRKHEIL